MAELKTDNLAADPYAGLPRLTPADARALAQAQGATLHFRPEEIEVMPWDPGEAEAFDAALEEWRQEGLAAEAARQEELEP